MEGKKILFVAEYFKPHVGGAEVLFENLINGLVSKGYFVTVLTTKYKPELQSYEKIGENLEIYRVGSNRYNFMRFAFWKMLSLLADKSYYLIQTTTFNAALPSGLIKFFKKIPVILHVHEIYGNLRYRFMGLKGFFYKIFEWLIFQFSFDHYTCSSLYTKNQLRIAFGIDDVKLTTTYCGIDYDFRDPAKIDQGRVDEIRKKYNLTDKYVGLYFGRAGVEKGVLDFLKSIPLILNMIPSYHAVMVVPFNKIEDKLSDVIINDTINDLGIGNKITLLYDINNELIRDYIGIGDVVILPTYTEGFGLAIAESCALGKKLITTNIGAVPEVAGGNVFFINPGDYKGISSGVLEFLNGRQKNIELKKYYRDDCVDSFINVYNYFIV